MDGQNKSQFLQAIINDYLAEHPEERDWKMPDVAAWAIRNDRWHPPTRDMIKVLANELSSAARVEYETDPRGRRVRTKHARRETLIVEGEPTQLVFWEDIHNATPEHMKVSLQQRRQGVLADCGQLKRDADSYNENNIHGADIQLSFDFTEDLLEMEAPEEYPEVSPDQQQEDETENIGD